MKLSDSQLVKGASVQKTNGKHCGRVLKDCLCAHEVGSLVATVEAKGVPGLCLVCTAAAHTCDLNLSAKREGLRIAPNRFYHLKPNYSNHPTYFQIFPEGQGGQNTPLIFPDWAAQGTVAEHSSKSVTAYMSHSRETQHTHTQTFCGVHGFHGCAISFVFITTANSTRITFVESAFFLFFFLRERAQSNKQRKRLEALTSAHLRVPHLLLQK